VFVAQRLDTRPLLDTAPDAQLFVNREPELKRVLQAATSDLNAVVLGDRGIGKTSLIRQAAYQLRQRGQPAHVVDAALAESAEGVLYAIEAALGAEPQTSEVMQAAIGRLGRPRRAPGSEAVDVIGRLGDVEPTILMLDNLPSPKVAHDLFGRLRDELWTLRHTWVVTADRSDARTILAPPADAFFAVRIELLPLAEHAAEDLLERRLSYGDRALASQLGQSGEGNPRKLLELARQVVIDGGGQQAAYRLMEQRVRAETAASELGRSHAMLFAELLALGSASPSDPALLERMGWSRPRANQVLRDLEHHALAVASDELPDGAGKPRRVYRPAYQGHPL
jgi:hypothetical protein